MPTENDSIWEGFESVFFRDAGAESLSETEPSAGVRSTIADQRQILPILFLIDVSGSMRGQRIAQVNYALENIFKELRRRDDMQSVIKIGIMEFADEGRWVTPQPVLLDDFVFTQIEARQWGTLYSKAFDALNDKLRREGFMDPKLGEYFAPLILLVTDGEPMDENEYPAALARLQSNGWFRKSIKYAIAAGDEAKKPEVGRILSEFTGVRENVRFADEGEALCNLIEFIAIRASEVQTSLLSAGPQTTKAQESIFADTDSSLFSSMFETD